MADNVSMVLLTTADEGRTGDEIQVSPSRALELRRGGAARPSTVPDARALGLEDTEADTKHEHGPVAKSRQPKTAEPTGDAS